MQTSSRKNSCGDLQSRLKIRKVLGVGDAGSGQTSSSKIGQILGQSDLLIFRLPEKLNVWWIFLTGIFTFFTLTGFFFPAIFRCFLPGKIDSTHQLAICYAFFSFVLGSTFRCADRNSFQLVLSALIGFHTLSSFAIFLFFNVDETRIKSTISMFFHWICLIVDLHFYRIVAPNSLNIFFNRFDKMKNYFQENFSTPQNSRPENFFVSKTSD